MRNRRKKSDENTWIKVEEILKRPEIISIPSISYMLKKGKRKGTYMCPHIYRHTLISEQREI